MTPVISSARVQKFQRMTVTLLIISAVVNYIDRSTLAIANPLIREELGVSVAQMGFLLSAFSWSYALAQLPVGALADRLGPRILLGVGLVL